MLAAIFSSVDAFYFFSFASRGAHFRAAYFYSPIDGFFVSSSSFHYWKYPK